MTRIPRYFCSLGFGVGVAVAGACNPGPGQDSSATPAETGDCMGGENCFCMDDSDCGPGLVCASRLCTPASEGTTSTSSTTEGESSTGTTSEPGTTFGPTGDSTGQSETSGTECDPAQGVANAMCDDPQKPYCEPGGTCVDCTGIASCSDISDVAPVCDEASGKCVVCTAEDTSACEGNTPVCGSLNTCVACTAHSECDSGACNFATGACFASILYVDQGATCAAGTGSMELPLCEIQQAVDKVQNQPLVVRVRTSQTPYKNQVQVASGKTVAIVRDGNTGTVTLAVPNLDAVVVNNGALAFLENITITGGAAIPALRCTNLAKVWLDQVTIEKRDGYAIQGDECDVILRRSKLYENKAGGLRLSGGEARIENSYIVQNGNSFGSISAVHVGSSAAVDIVYSTIADNDAMGGVGESLHCQTPGPVSLRNSILFGKAANTSVICPTATAKDSVVDAMSLTGTNVQYETMLVPSWFNNPAMGDFSIKPGMPFQDVATWRVGDPSVDYDGDTRITADGTMDYSGADRPN